MNVSLYQAAAAMNAHSRWQDVIAQNLAAGSSPGYRRQEVSFAQVEAGLPTTLPGGLQGRFHIPAANTATVFQQGSMRPSQGQLDFAIDGQGFFEVQLPNGDTGYTRDGEFQLNAQGHLVTKQGHLVLSDAGPIQIDPANPAPLTVSSNGTVSQGNDPKGKLRLAEFDQPNQLTTIGGGLFITGASGAQPQPAASSLIRQGYLETSNATPTLEMSNLITAMRMFEVNQRVITMQDERLGKTITELGNPN